jgi:twitching motility protein PilT
MNIIDFLKTMTDANASDIIFKVGSPPAMRVDGKLQLMSNETLTPETAQDLIFSILNDKQKKLLIDRDCNELDLAYSVAGLARFRANIFYQRGSLGMVMRRIPLNVPKFEDLNLPASVKTLAEERRGLVLVTGTTGSGKTTTLSSIIDYINSTRDAHIITIEDPIEVLHRDNKSIVTQREVGMDTDTFVSALKYVLRQNPDVILIGEMRDMETIDSALVAAETGHLVLSTLHTIDSAQTVNRIVDVHPPHQQKQTRIALASVLKGIVSQRLLPKIDGKGRVPAVEVMITTARIRELLLKAEDLSQITDAIKEGQAQYGMQTFDQSLLQLYKDGLIAFEDAEKSATSPGDLRIAKRQLDYANRPSNK